jgi:hypothetical protein
MAQMGTATIALVLLIGTGISVATVFATLLATGFTVTSRSLYRRQP